MIKIILIFGLFACASIYFFRLRSQLRDRIVSLFVFICGVVFVLFPQVTSWLARLLGIGRGADLIFYFAVLGLLFLFALFNIRMREKELQITELTRNLAILNATKPVASSSTITANGGNRTG